MKTTEATMQNAIKLLRQALDYPNLACFRPVLKYGYYDHATIQACYESRLEYMDEYPSPKEIAHCERLYKVLVEMTEYEVSCAVMRM